MLPPRIADGFSRQPEDLIGLCRTYSWDELTRPPRKGMRPIRDILVHMMDTEGYWIGHVVSGAPDQKFAPKAFGDLDAILTAWNPQREASLAFLRALTPKERADRRPLPWDKRQSASVEEIVWHVVTHDQYHRGQIFTRLALLGRRDLPSTIFGASPPRRRRRAGAP